MIPMSPRLRPGPFALAAAASGSLILAGPFIGEIRRAILLRFPGQFGRIITAIVLVAIVTAVGVALTRIREQRAWRYGALAAALAAAVAYSLATRTGDPTVDAVQYFHFVEYGLVTFLFYRAWRPAGDLSTLVLPVLAGLLVGTLEEWFQWFIPARVGDVWDVVLNGVAILCGLTFSVAVDPPGRQALAAGGAALRRIGAFAAVVCVAFGFFFQSVHLGDAVTGDGWMFRSGIGGAALDAASADRAVRWRGTFIDRPKRLSAEDQYATEGLWHVQRRNRAWQAGDVVAAWNENLILERYFAPVLDTPSYVSKSGHRWSAEQRRDAERRVKLDAEQRSRAASPTAVYVSDAEPGALHLWPRRLYWTAVLATAALLVTPWLLARRRRAAAPVRRDPAIR